MVEEVALRLEIVGARHVHREPVVQQGEQLLLHHGGELAVPMDLVGGRELEQLLLDERELAAVEVLERELSAPADRLAVDEIELAPLLVRMM